MTTNFGDSVMKKDHNRRNFLAKLAKIFSFATTGPWMLSANLLNKSQKKNIDLAVVKGDPEKAIFQTFTLLGGIDRFIKPGDIVLLKPNVSFPNPPQLGSTTNPQIVKIVAEYALGAGAKRVYVADNTMREGNICFERTGLISALRELDDVKILPLQKESLYHEVAVSNGKALQALKIAKLIQRCDVVINMPCAKSHVATDVSFGLKNLMGLIWDRQFFHSGTDIHTAIAELATVIRPHVTILDATRALVTGGPTGPGKVQEHNMVIAGIDPLAVDSYATTITNWNNRSLSANRIKHLSYAATIGVGEMDLKKLRIEERKL